MEELVPQQLAIESFSYSWLSDTNPNSFSSSSTSYNHKSSHNFDFDVHLSTSPSQNLSHADEIFSDGHIKPLFLQQHRLSPSSSKEIAGLRRASISLPSSPIPSYASENYNYDGTAVGKLKRPSSAAAYKRIFRKCFKFVKSIGSTRKSSRVSDVEGKAPRFHSSSPGQLSIYSDSKKACLSNGLKKMKSWGSFSSPQASPRISPSSYYSNCNNNVWSEVDQSSIHEAILYCKRSIEK